MKLDNEWGAGEPSIWEQLGGGSGGFWDVMSGVGAGIFILMTMYCTYLAVTWFMKAAR